MILATPDICVFPEISNMVVRTSDPVRFKELSSLPSVSTQEDMVLLPWTIGACRFLQNIGIEALEAVPFYFDPNPRMVEGRYAPMRHQRQTAAFMAMYPRGYLLADPRTGKTASAILGADYLQRIHAITGGVLVITTLTTMHGVWKTSIETTVPGARVVMVHGKGREDALDTPADFYVTNYDSCRLSEAAFMKACREKRIGAVIVDELTHVGNSSSKRHKAIYNICNKGGVKYVWGLTGSPADNPEMVYGMCRVINPAKLPVTTKTAWLNLTTIQWGSEPYQRSVARSAPDTIHKAMQPAIRFNKKDIIDLPPVTTQVRECGMSTEQNRLRNELRDEAITLLKSGEVITAANGGVLMGKILQVALGVVRKADGDPVALPHRERTEAILDAIEETSRKVVIFCGYTAAIRMLVEEIRKAGYSCEMVDGSVTGERRGVILSDFQCKPDPRVLVCHPATTAMGVELSAADTMIFNGVPLTGGFVYAQSLERLSSGKQTADSINIIHIISTPEERKALAHLQKGYDFGRNVAAMFEDFLSVM